MVAPVPVAVRRPAARSGPPELLTTPLGTLDGGVLAEVDRAGAVRPVGSEWSLDWWIGAEDRWHHPSMEAAVRQQAYEATAVVQTALKVPGGDVVQRVAAAVVRSGSWSGDAVVVEVENLSPTPVGLALSIRPWRLDRRGRISEVRIDGTTVLVDGQPAVLFPRPAVRMVHGGTEEVAVRLAAGEDGPPESLVRRDRRQDDGDLEVALVLPLQHGATAKLVVLAPSAGLRRPKRVALPSGAFDAPALSAVASGWKAHCREDAQIVLPQAQWSELLAWSGQMLRIAGPPEITAALARSARSGAGTRDRGAPSAAARVASVTAALAGLPVPEIHDAAAAALCTAQRFNGEVRLADRSDATVGMLFAAGATLAGPLRARRADELIGPVAGAMRHLSRRSERAVGEAGARRAAVALVRLAPGLAAAGQPELAQEVVAASVELFDSAAEPEPRPLDHGGAGPASTLARARADHDAILAGSAGSVDVLGSRLAGRGLRGMNDTVDGAGRAVGEMGFDPGELAELRLSLLDMLVADGPRGPVLIPSWSDQWYAQPIEAHGIPTAWGSVSFALRWHEGHPALLWQIEPLLGRPGGSVAPEVRSPGLDPRWRGGGWSGESLLARKPEPSGGWGAASGFGESSGGGAGTAEDVPS